MSYELKQNLANRANYGSKRDLSKIKYLVIHYTNNDGDSDEANGKYFAREVVKASAHYFVDDDSVTQSVPDNYAAYAVGGKCQSNHHPYYGTIKNTNSISIEMCDNHKDGTVHICDETLANTYALARALMKKYNIDIDHVVRHHDVNGKLCPNCNGLLNDNVWQTFKNNIVNSTTGALGTGTVVPAAAKNDKLDSLIARGQQHSINFTGHSIATDGAYGPKTQANVARWMCSGLEAAVKQFQSDRGLKVDGIAGRNTILKLMGV